MKTIKSTLSIFMMFVLLLAGCSKDDDPIGPELPKATVSNVEIGLGNNEIGVIGKDFHFQADILAATKIQDVIIKMQQRSNENYKSKWSYEKGWSQYTGAKNTTVHEHVIIPEEAPEGKYDFLIIVKDQNGSILEEKKSITLYSEANLPVNPSLSLFMMFNNKLPFYINSKFLNGNTLKLDDEIKAEVSIDNVKGDGKMYILLINKKLNHRPESIEKIDFTKAIVYDVVEHKQVSNTGLFSNATVNPETSEVIRSAPLFKIGADIDNNIPVGGSINGKKVWESGTYYVGVLYKNTTYNLSLFEYTECKIEGF